MSEENLSKTATAEAAPQQKEREPYDPEELIGKTLAGRYEVEKCIGKGGMGVVYLASQNALGRKVVIKVLPRDFGDDEEAMGRFEREAVGMSRLQHPHVVSIYDFGHDEDQAYICMEFVDGETLSRRIKRDGPMDVETFAAVAAQILQGIGEAHALGLIHRDIKPSNIMLTQRHDRENYVKILDFGLAKLVKNSRKVTKEQSLVGSTAFLSPEQIMGNDIDQRVDVYALGVLFFYMLTGEKPFTADDDITVLYQHVHNEPPPLADHLPAGHRVPDAVVALIERMLAKEPEDRPQDAGSIREELTDIMATTSLQIAWSTGEYGAVGPDGADDPSDQLRGRRQTPMGQLGPGTSTSGLQVADTGSQSNQTGFVTGEQLLQIQKESNRRTMLIVAVAVLVVAAGLSAFFMTRDSGAGADEVQNEIARAEKLVENGKLGQAESVLDLLESDVAHHPSLKSGYAAAQDKLAVAQLLNQARLQADQGKLEAAISTYQKLLSRNASHEEAKEGLSEAKAALEAREEREREKAEESEAGKEKESEEVIESEEGNEKESGEVKRAAKKPASKPVAKSKPKPKPAAKPKPAEKSDDDLLVPIDEQPADEPSNDDVQLLPID